jgi:hypothetical protein
MQNAKKGFRYVIGRIDESEITGLAAVKLWIDFSKQPEGPGGSGLLLMLYGLQGQRLPPAAVRLAAKVGGSRIRTIGSASHDQGFRTGSCRLCLIPRRPKYERTRVDTARMPGAFRGTDGSKPVPSSGESAANLSTERRACAHSRAVTGDHFGELLLGQTQHDAAFADPPGDMVVDRDG